MRPARLGWFIKTGRLILLLAAFQVLALGLAGCAPRQPEENESTRPACVTLPAYSAVIQQVMGVSPTWGPPLPVTQGSRTTWETQDDKGTYALSAVLTPDGCICATAATGRFVGGFSQGQFAGQLQGAAVAAVSELDYTAGWLEPKLLLRCPLAFLLRNEYRAAAAMPDATAWELVCTRDSAEGQGDLMTSLTVASSACLETTE